MWSINILYRQKSGIIGANLSEERFFPEPFFKRGSLNNIHIFAYSIFKPTYYLRRLFMNEDILWDKFAVSGRIEDYLRYSACREDKNDNC